ncbi:MAG TPA: helix-turn-helix transcriptional regulator [Candidatus Sulfotelmatobacter sp.]|jgi:transcriptional regulator with XRE-family HTH domain|nr:helix-turn-helix transcriptional regulator [Candidatus Sulfotelmatobacter sp.]
MDLKDLVKELSKKPEVKKEFESYDLPYEISQMLIEARILKGITQKKLAEMIHTKQSGIARAERGVSLPSLSFLEKIAKALRTHLIVRFGFMENMSVKVNEKSQNTTPQPKLRIVTNKNPNAYTPSFVYVASKAEPNSIKDLGGIHTYA